MKNDSVTVICYGKEEQWESRKNAMKFFFEGMCSCEGSEQERYEKIFTELSLGYSVCADE